MDPLARKELLKADARFMKIFDAWANYMRVYPGEGENISDEAKSAFDYAFNIIFDCTGDDGIPRYTKGTQDAIKAFGIMYASGEFNPVIAERHITAFDQTGGPWEMAENFDETAFNTLTENYLTTVYSNVKSFETTSCSLENNKLIIEGVIKFTSGKSKSTTFIYEAKNTVNHSIILEGVNTDLANGKAFVLNCKIDTENCLIVESLNYNYIIENTLVEGLLK
jgi:hypothetical protein